MRIITISREFGSGGRELGKRMAYPITIGCTLSYPAYMQQNEINILISQQRVMKKLAARGDCVVMGQRADSILKEYQPMKLFIYADTESKIKRCQERRPKKEHLTDREMLRNTLSSGLK